MVSMFDETKIVSGYDSPMSTANPLPEKKFYGKSRKDNN
jgi:hypothetical protein